MAVIIGAEAFVSSFSLSFDFSFLFFYFSI